MHSQSEVMEDESVHSDLVAMEIENNEEAECITLKTFKINIDMYNFSEPLTYNNENLSVITSKHHKTSHVFYSYIKRRRENLAPGRWRTPDRLWR